MSSPQERAAPAPSVPPGSRPGEPRPGKRPAERSPGPARGEKTAPAARPFRGSVRCEYALELASNEAAGLARRFLKDALWGLNVLSLALRFGGRDFAEGDGRAFRELLRGFARTAAALDAGLARLDAETAEFLRSPKIRGAVTRKLSRRVVLKHPLQREFVALLEKTDRLVVMNSLLRIGDRDAAGREAAIARLRNRLIDLCAHILSCRRRAEKYLPGARAPGPAGAPGGASPDIPRGNNII